MSIVHKIVSHPVIKTAVVRGFGLGARAGRAGFTQIGSLVGRLGIGGGSASPAADTPDDSGRQGPPDPTPSEPDVSTLQGPPDPTPSGPVFPAPARPGAGTSAPVPEPDEHVEPGVRLAYSSGPDVEETIEELRATDPDDRV